MSASIFFHPEAYSIAGPKLMGRNAAGESFLRGYFRHSKAASFSAQVSNAEHGKAFKQAALAQGRQEPVSYFDKTGLHKLRESGAIFYPGPGLAEAAYHRTGFGAASWSLCGITHTTSSALAMDALAELLSAPVQAWDAVICTSRAVKDNVLRLLQAQAQYLQQRLGATRFILPQLPVIPLGVSVQDFHFSVAQKQAARQALGLAGDTLVVLFMGRLSFHAKAHPLAMYQALEIAARAAGKPVVLIECGWHANDFIAQSYAAAAALACPTVKTITLDGRKAEERQKAWSAADVFCSLSDNIQETFGIAPVEAMAAGLPAVVSDWDGYKDTIRDGVDGFRIPTLMPGPGLGADLAQRHALGIDTYDMYIGQSAMLAAVDIAAAAAAFQRLFLDAELRQAMGQAARARALQLYDWAAIIPEYEKLWAEMGEIRRVEGAKLKPLTHPWPARMDPFHGFAGYASQHLRPDMCFELADADLAAAQARLRGYRGLAMVNFAKFIMPREAEMALLLEAAASGPMSAAEMVRQVPVQRQAAAFRAILWLQKLGLLRLSSP